MVVAQRPSRVLVVGLGTSGLAAARLALAQGFEVSLTDQRPESDLADTLALLPPDLRTYLGGHPEASLDGVDTVVLSPGVPIDSTLVDAAKSRGIQILSEVEFAWTFRTEAPLVAVTGSNGKSTVTTLIAEILAREGGRVVAGANLGTAASQLVLDGGWDTWVLEISSFQSEIFNAFKPTVGVFLNLSQDHLERHGAMTEYARAKQRLFARQGPGDLAVLNADDPMVAATVTGGGTRVFSLEGPADGRIADGRLVFNGEDLLAVRDLGLTGRHNVANALAAGLAAQAMGARGETIAAVLRTFAGLPHRHTVVHQKAGVQWVDDSKATNVGAALAALEGYDDSSVHLILGGLGKDQDFSVMAKTVQRVAVRVYLIGRDADRIRADLGNAEIEMCDTLERAVASARERVRPGQMVLLAPACASFDQFTGYAQRGEHFARLARGES